METLPNDKQYKHYELFENSITINIDNEENTVPDQNFYPYSKRIKKFVDILTTSKNISEDKKVSSINNEGKNEEFNPTMINYKNNTQQVIMYVDPNNYNYILKRTSLNVLTLKEKFTKEEEKKFLNDLRIKEFLNTCLKEFVFNRINSAHPSGVLSLDFEITALTKLNLIIFEMLIENGGTPFIDVYFDSNGKIKKEKKAKAFTYFKELIDSLAHLERINIAHHDIKHQNILIDRDDKIKLIDFDISIDLNSDDSMSVYSEISPIGYSSGYVSPEALRISTNKSNLNEPIDSKNNEKEGKKMEKENNISKEEIKKNNSWKIRPFKSDIYSCGIFALVLSGALDPTRIEEIDRFKVQDKGVHELMEETLIKNSVWESEQGLNNELTEKMRLIISYCIKLDPNERINFRTLKRLFTNIDQYSTEYISSIIKTYLKNQANTKEEMKIRMNDLISENQELKLKLEDMNHKYEYIKYILKESKKDSPGNKNQNDTFNEDSDITNLDQLFSVMININSKMIKKYLSYMQINNPYNYGENKNWIYEIIPINIAGLPQYINQVRIECRNHKPQKNTKMIFEEGSPNLATLNLKTEEYEPTYNDAYDIAKQFFNSHNNVNNIYNHLEDRIKDTINPIPKYWNFWKMDINKENLLFILQLAKRKTNIEKILFYGNPKFDEKCGKYYLKVLTHSESFIGVDLFKLDFSKNLKKKILKLINSNDNFKYVIIEKEAFEKFELKQYVTDLNLNYNFHSSKYWSKEI